MPFTHPNSGIQKRVSNKLVNITVIRLNSMTKRIKANSETPSLICDDTPIVDCCRNETKRLLPSNNSVPVSIYPIPPACMSNAITNCPSGVKSDPVSSVTNPVTVIAEAAVKSRSIRSALCVRLHGSHSKKVPINDAPAKTQSGFHPQIPRNYAG